MENITGLDSLSGLNSDLNSLLLLDTKMRIDASSLDNNVASPKLPTYAPVDFGLSGSNTGSFLSNIPKQSSLDVLNNTNPIDNYFTDPDFANSFRQGAVAANLPRPKPEDYALNTKTVNLGDPQIAKHFGLSGRGFTYGLDNDDIEARETSNWMFPVNLVGRVVFPAITKFIGGTASLGSAIIKSPFALYDHVYDAGLNINLADNAISRAMEHLEEGFKTEILPVYQAATNREKGFFYRLANDSTLYTNELADGLAFLGSAYISGGLASSARLGSWLTSKAANILSKTQSLKSGLLANSTLNAKRAAEITEGYLKNAERFGKSLDKFTVTALNSASEANLEGIQVREKVFNDAILAGKSLDEAESLANNAHKNVFLANLAVLTLSNSLFETNLIMRALGKNGSTTARGITSKGTGQAVGEYAEKRWTKTIFRENLANNNKVVKGLQKFTDSRAGNIVGQIAKGYVTEGLWEENAQLAIQRTFENPDNLGVGFLDSVSNVASQYKNQTLDALGFTENDDIEASLSIGLGALIGTTGIAFSELTGSEYNKLKTARNQKITELNKAQMNAFYASNIYELNDKGEIVYENGSPKVDNVKADALKSKILDETRKLTKAAKSQSELEKRNLSKSNMTDFVLAHVDTGFNGAKVANAKVDIWKDNLTEAEILSMGYESKDDFKKEIENIKNLNNQVWEVATSIKNDMNFEASNPEDEALQIVRKNYLLRNARNQLIKKSEIEHSRGEISQLKARAANLQIRINDPLPQPLAQINELIQRIMSNKQTMKGVDPKSESFATMKELDVNLGKELADLKKQQEGITYEDYKVGKNGMYESVIPQNISDIEQTIKNVEKRIGEFQNSIDTDVISWYKYADYKNGLTNFKTDKLKTDEKISSNDDAPKDPHENVDPSKPRVKFTNLDGIEMEIVEGETYYFGNTFDKIEKIDLNTGKKYVLKDRSMVTIKSIDLQKGTVRMLVDTVSNGKQDITVKIDILKNAKNILRNINTLSPLKRFVFFNLNKTFRYEIVLRRNNGNFIYDKTTNVWRTVRTPEEQAEANRLKGVEMRQVVDARLGYRPATNDNPEEVVVEFINPLTGKPDTRSVSLEWFNKNKKSKFFELDYENNVLLNEITEAIAKQNVKTQTQISYFQKVIERIEREIEDSKKRRTTIDENTLEIQIAIEEATNELNKIKEEIENLLSDKDSYTEKKGKLKKSAKETLDKLTDALKSFENKIAHSETTLSKIEEEVKFVESSLEALEKSRDFYYSLYGEVVDNNQPIDLSEQGFKQKQEEINEFAKSTGAAIYNFEQLNSIIDDLSYDLYLLKNHNDNLRKDIDSVRKAILDAIQSLVVNFDVSSDEKGFILNELNSIYQGYLDGTKTQEESLNEFNNYLKGVMQNLEYPENVKSLVNNFDKKLEDLNRLSKAQSDIQDEVSRFKEILANKYQVQEMENSLNGLRNVVEEFTKIMKDDLEQKSKSQAAAGNPTNQQAPNPQNFEKGEESAIPEDQIVQDIKEYDKATPLNETTINKSFGRHINEDGSFTNEADKRFYYFTSRVNMASAAQQGRPYELMVVTSENDEFGILYENEKTGYSKANDIKLVLVRKEKGKYYYVDMNGNNIENPTKDNIVYTSEPYMANIKTDEEKIEWAKRNFSLQNLSAKKIVELVNKKIENQKRLVATVKTKNTNGQRVYLGITSVLPGINNKVPLVDGKVQKQPVEGVLLPKDSSDAAIGQVKLQVATSSTQGYDPNSRTVAIGTHRFPPGAVVIMDPTSGKPIRLNNRNLTDNELKTVAKAIARLYYTFNNPQVNVAERNGLITYLKGVLNWRLPDDKRSINEQQLYIDNGLYMGEEQLLADYQINEQNIYEALQKLNLYHGVSNALLNNDTFAIPVFNNDGSVESFEREQIGSYKKYLLKSAETPVLTTNSVSSIESTPDKPLFFNAQMTYIYPSNMENVQQSSQGAQQSTQPNPQQPAANPNTPPNSNSNVPQNAPSRKEEGILSEVEVHNGFTYVIKFGSTNTVVLAKEVNPNPIRSNVDDNWTLLNEPDGYYVVNLQTSADLNYKIVFKKENNTVEQVYYQVFKKDSNGGWVDTTFEGAGLNFEKAYQIYFDGKGGNFKLSDIPSNRDIRLVTVRTTTPKPKVVPEGQVQTATVTEDSQANKTPSVSEDQSDMDLSEIPDDSLLDGEYRLIQEDDTSEQENFTEFMTWLEERLPQFAVKIKEGLPIDGIAQGKFVNNVIELWENAKAGTGFHEAFEAVWNSLLTEDQKIELINEFRSRSGSFQYAFDKSRTIKYSEATVKEAKETYAEEFAQYVRNNGKGIDKGRPKKNSLFRRIWEFIKSLLGIAPESIQQTKLKANELFKAIEEGRFSKLEPSAQFTSEYKAIEGLNQLVTSRIINNMHSNIFRELFINNENIESLLSKDNKELLTKTFDNAKQALYANLIELVNKYADLATKEKDSNKLKNIDYNKKYYQSLANFVLQNYETLIVPSYMEFLKKYKISFTEVDSKAEDINSIFEDLQDNESKDRSYDFDSAYIDSRNLLNTSIKLLLSSLTEMEYKNGQLFDIKTIDSFNSPKLVKYGKVVNILLNDLSGIVPIYRNGQLVSRLDLMFEKLDSKYKIGDEYQVGFEWIAQLKDRLKYENYDGVKYPIENLTLSDIKFRVAFEKSFSNNQYLPVKLQVKKNGGAFANIVRIDAVTENNERQIVNDWLSYAKSSYLNGNNPYIDLQTNGKLAISIDKLRKDGYLGNNTIDKDFEFLSKLGIEFTFDKRLVKVTGTTDNQLFQKSVASIKFVLDNATDIITVEDILQGKKLVNKPIKDLLSLEVANKKSEQLLMYRNAEGKNEYSVSLPTTYSNIVNSLNGVDNIYDFILTNPQYGSIVNGKVVLKNYQKNSIFLKPGGLFFDADGNKRKNLKVLRISGITKEGSSEGITTKDLVEKDRIAQEVNLMLMGIYYTVINSDKSSEFGLEFGQIVDFKNSFNTAKIVSKYYIGHLEDELRDLIDYHRKDGKHVRPNIEFYTDNLKAKKLSHFQDIFPDSPQIVDKIIESKDIEKALIEFLSSKSTHDRIINYIDGTYEVNGKKEDGLVLSFYNYLINNDIFVKAPNTSMSSKVDPVTKKPYFRYYTHHISNEELRKLDASFSNLDMTESDIMSLAKYLAINHNLLTKEQHKLVYGDLRMYKKKDFPKRSNATNSTKEAIIEDINVRAWMDNTWQRLDGKLRSSEELSTLNATSYSDVDVISKSNNLEYIAESFYESLMNDYKDREDAKSHVESLIGAEFDENGKVTKFNIKKSTLLSGYSKFTEADAQAYIMMDMYRDLLFLSGKLTQKQIDLINYEVAYERLYRSGYIKSEKTGKLVDTNSPSYKKFYDKDSDLFKSDVEAYNKGRNDAILPTLKPQYFGYSINENRPESDSVLRPVFLKNSTTPLFYSFVEGRPAENLYINSQNKQHDIIGFQSGQKVGNVTDSNGDLKNLYTNGTVDGSDSITQRLRSLYFGIQVEMAPKTKKQVLRGSQVTKLILTNLMEFGKMYGNENTEVVDKLINDYLTNLRAIITDGRNSLLTKLGLEEVNGRFETSNLSDLMTTLQQEAIRSDLPDNIAEMLQIDPDNVKEVKYVFDAGPVRDKIENMIMAIIDSNIIHQKTSGKMSAQVASTMFETKDRTFAYLNKNTNKYETISGDKLSELDKDSKVMMTSNELSFYADGKGMEVYLPYYYADKLGIGNLDINKIDKRLLQLIGYRIPTQSLGQVEYITIAGFLPPSMGDIIIVPSEIVTKSGSDFDIDKLTLYIPNFFVKDGKPHYIEYETSLDDESVKNRWERRYNKWNKILQKYEKLIQDKRNELSPANDFINSLVNYNASKSNKNVEEISNYDFTDEEILQLVDKDSKGIALVKLRDLARKESKSRPTFEEFKNLPIELQNTRKALENRNIQIMTDILKLKNNKRQMFMPNSAQSLKDLETEIFDAMGEEAESSSLTKYGEFATTSKIRHTFLNAKALVGVGAVQITSHTISQLANIELTGYYGIERAPLDIKFETPLSDNGSYSLAHIKTRDGKYISEILSEFLSGFVDAAKDPFVFNININFRTSATWFYLLKLGIPLKEVAYFMNQPAIREYVKLQDKKDSKISKFKSISGKNLANEMLNNLKKKVGVENTSLLEIPKELFTEGALLKNIEAYKTKGDTYYMNQLIYLTEFIRYSDQAQYMNSFVNSLAVDTFKAKSVVENLLLIEKLKNVKKAKFIKNPEDAFNNTFLGKLYNYRRSVTGMTSNYFVTSTEKVLPTIVKMVNKVAALDYVSDESRKKMLNKFQNFLLTHIIQNTAYKRSTVNGKVETRLSNYYDLLIPNSGKSVAKTLLNLKKKYPTNEFLKLISPILSDNSKGTDNIRIFNNSLSTFEINVASESMIDLIKIAKSKNDQELEKFLKNVIAFSLLQSGQSQSPINISKLMHHEQYLKLTNDILLNFLNSTNQINDKLVLKQFYQNNWKDEDLVPTLEERMDNSTMEMYVNGLTYPNQDSPYYRLSERVKNSGRDYVKINLGQDTSIENTNPSIVLLQRIGYDEESKSFIYSRVNALGNGMYATETYPTDTSVMNQQDIKLSYINGYVEEMPSNPTDEVEEETEEIFNDEITQNITTNNFENTENNNTFEESINKVLEGNIFELQGIPVIPTNLEGIHGAGLANQAYKKGLIEYKDGAFKATDLVVQLPVKGADPSTRRPGRGAFSETVTGKNIQLLVESLQNLIEVSRNNPTQTYLLPLVGLGHGEGSVEVILPMLIATVKASPNIKLVLAKPSTNLGTAGTARTDRSQENMPKIKSMLQEAGLILNEFVLADKLPPIEQNFKDGDKYKDQDGNWRERKMQPQYEGKSTMDLIIQGIRTRTTRAKTDIQRIMNDYNLQKVSDLIGKIIRMTDKSGIQVYTRITNIAKFTQEYQDATWQKEGWQKDVTDRLVGKYPYAIEFEVINNNSKINDLNINEELNDSETQCP